MGRHPFFTIFGLAVVLIAATAHGAYAQQQMQLSQDNQGPYERPVHMSDLTYLTPGLYNKGLNKTQWTEVLLSWLTEEITVPTETFTGLGGGPIDSNYMQAQILKTLAVEGDALAINWLLSSPQLKDEHLRNSLRLVLGGMGDKRQIPSLIKILMSDPIPDYRALAADDLYLLQAVEAIPALEKARSDKYSLTFDDIHRGRMTLYPVRRAVEPALRSLKDLKAAAKADPEGMAYQRQWVENFTKLLAEMPRYSVAKRRQLSRLLDAIQPRTDQ